MGGAEDAWRRSGQTWILSTARTRKPLLLRRHIYHFAFHELSGILVAALVILLSAAHQGVGPWLRTN